MVTLTGIQWILALVAGGIVGFTLGLIGGGGSILAVPLLLYLVGVHNAHVVIGTTALAVAVNAFINVVPHWRAGHVRWKAAVGFALPGAMGAVIGSVFGKLVDGKVILFLFAILMMVIAVLMLRPKKVGHEATKMTVRLGRVMPAGLGTGLVAGFFGIGGGFLIVPGLMFSTGMAMTDAIGTSLFSVGTFGLTTAVSYALSGLVDWLIVALYISGGILGGFAGAKACTILGRNTRRLQFVFSGIIILVAVYMLYVNAVALHLLH